MSETVICLTVTPLQIINNKAVHPGTGDSIERCHYEQEFQAVSKT